jgi:antibiotic biosynthesis monooxygenase (ABM) superfamily enzyme
MWRKVERSTRQALDGLAPWFEHDASPDQATRRWRANHMASQQSASSIRHASSWLSAIALLMFVYTLLLMVSP